MRIDLLLHSLERGGAERQAAYLARGLIERGHDLAVAVFHGGGPWEAELAAAGVPLTDLAKKAGTAGFAARLLRYYARRRPQVIYAMLDVPNLVALAARAATPRSRVVWGVRNSYENYAGRMLVVRLGFYLACRMAPLASAVICNSRAGRDLRLRRGAPPGRTLFIPNAVDTRLFAPDPEAGRALRRQWSVADHETLLGVVGRLNPVKDHAGLLRAMALLRDQGRRVRLACVGAGPDDFAARLAGLGRELGLEDRVIWAGAREDMPVVYNAFDVAVNASLSEGMPNTVAEAMACGRPCLVSDAGDSAWLVGRPDLVVPVGDAPALARGLARLLDLPEQDQAALGRELRRRAESEFSLQALVERSEAVFASLVAGRPLAPALNPRRP